MDKRGKEFIHLAHENNKSVLVWTVNVPYPHQITLTTKSELWMKWAMCLKTDAVLTNDPEKYLALRDHVPSEQDHPTNWPFKDQLSLYFWSWFGVFIMSLRIWRYSGRGGWKEKLGNVEERIVEGGISEKVQEIH